MESEAVDRLFAEAIAVVERANLPADLRPVGFKSAIDLLKDRSLTEAKPSAPKSAAVPTSDGRAGRTQALSSKLGADVPIVEEAFDVTDKTLQLVVPRSKLGGDRAEASRSIALLVCAGRQGAGFEEWTAVDTVREQCRQFNVLDSSNFAATIASMTEFFLFRGSSRQRELRVTRAGFDQAARLLKRLTGEER